jgi:dynein heavy chain
LQSKVGKLVGKNYGPPVGKKLKFFIDDINMPTVGTYGTQQPISFIVRLLTTELFLIDKTLRNKSS